MLFDKDEGLGVDPYKTKTLLISVGIHLLLVLGDQYPGTGVRKQVGHLGGWIGRVQADGGGPHRDRADSSTASR